MRRQGNDPSANQILVGNTDNLSLIYVVFISIRHLVIFIVKSKSSLFCFSFPSNEFKGLPVISEYPSRRCIGGTKHHNSQVFFPRFTCSVLTYLQLNSYPQRMHACNLWYSHSEKQEWFTHEPKVRTERRNVALVRTPPPNPYSENVLHRIHWKSQF
jgi:hypothetical protein